MPESSAFGSHLFSIENWFDGIIWWHLYHILRAPGLSTSVALPIEIRGKTRKMYRFWQLVNIGHIFALNEQITNSINEWNENVWAKKIEGEK